ncbi:MAG: hypothetical protein AAF821_20680 [Cyanobacteria bacterium P01_D01_bin.156]
MADRELQTAKYFTAGISFLLMALGGGVWPFIWWEMYSSGNYEPPTVAGRIELHVQDSNGDKHILRSMDLYTIDNDSSRQAAGHQLMYRAFTGSDEQQAIYRPYLIQQVATVLNTDIEQIEAWDYAWKIDFEQHPPLDIEQPFTTTLIHSFDTATIHSMLSQ